MEWVHKVSEHLILLVFQIGVYAILNCAQQLSEKRIFIVTNSQAALTALRSCEKSSGPALDCVSWLNELGADKIFGHADVTKNEETNV